MTQLVLLGEQGCGITDLSILIMHNRAISVNTVDTLYAAFPMFLYLNPELGGYLISPLLEYQDSSVYNQSYAALHIGVLDVASVCSIIDRFFVGSSYPNATSDDINDAHDYGIEGMGTSK